MDRDDWYRDRILWKTKQHKLFDKQCCEFSNLPEDNANTIKEVAGDIKPVVVFWKSKDKWTALGTRGVYSVYDGKSGFSELDKINKNLSIFHPTALQSDDVKLKSEFIKLDISGELIWVPAGSELFALMNILQMFPLSERIWHE